MSTTTNLPNPIESGDHWRPVAYVAMQDRAARQRIEARVKHFDRRATAEHGVFGEPNAPNPPSPICCNTL
jgi:hypothetical protein